METKPKVGYVYRFAPSFWDVHDRRPTTPQPGAIVRVVEQVTQGQVAVEGALTGEYCGIVAVASLIEVA